MRRPRRASWPPWESGRQGPCLLRAFHRDLAARAGGEGGRVWREVQPARCGRSAGRYGGSPAASTIATGLTRSRRRRRESAPTRAGCTARRGHLAMAESLWRRAATFDPDNRDCRMDLVALYRRRDRPEEVVKVFEATRRSPARQRAELLLLGHRSRRDGPEPRGRRRVPESRRH